MVAMIRSFERFMRLVAQSLEVLTDRDARVTTFGRESDDFLDGGVSLDG